MTPNSDESTRNNREVETESRQPARHIDPRSLFESAMAAQAAGDLTTAAALLRQVTIVAPHVEAGFFNLGNVLFQARDFDGAAAAYRSALLLETSSRTLNNLGNALSAAERWDDAIAAYREGLQRLPPPQEAVRLRRNLAQALERNESPSDALECLLAIDEPFRTEATILTDIVRLLTRLRRKHSLQEAVNLLSLKRAQSVPAEVASAQAYRLLGDLGSALKHAVEALSIQPEHTEALALIGELNMCRGRHGEATICLHRSMSLGARDPRTHSLWLQSLVYQGYNDGDRFFEEAQRWAEMHGSYGNTANSLPTPTPKTVRDVAWQRPIRVGFLLSSDDLLAIRATGAVLSSLDPNIVVPICYLDDSAADAADHWTESASYEIRSVSHLSDKALGRLFAHDRLDVLVDTTGHSGTNRLAILAGDSVPMKLAWGADFATTGLSCMDGVIVDEYVVPPQFETLFTEPALRLNQPSFSLPPELLERKPSIAGSPSVIHQEIAGSDSVGILCSSRSLTIDTIRLCTAILTEHTELILKIGHACFSDPSIVREITARFAEEGIDSDRLRFERLSNDAEHIDFLASIRLLLDPLPVGAPMAAALALACGTPVVCINGKQPSARRTAAVLCHVGLEEWIADSLEDCRSRVRSVLEQQTLDPSLSSRLRSSAIESKLFAPQSLAHRLSDILLTLTSPNNSQR